MPRRSVPNVLLAVLFMALGVAVPASAQDSSGAETPAHVSFVDGAAVLERDGRTDTQPLSMPLLAGDRLRTQGGRVEVLFADGSTLHLDANTVVDFQSDEVVRLLEGRVRLAITGSARDVSYRIDAPTAWVQVNVPGEYRVSILRNADVELAVLRGAAELVNEAGRSYVRAGERTFAREGASPTPPYVFNSAAWDDFDRWSEQRRDQRLGISAQYLPSDVRPYAASFDRHGSWRYEQAYGYVWYPRVAVGWRPYYHGRWVSLRPYGWTWVGNDPWGWPTHHYGRWGFSAGLWFWIPGRHWGPAWVSWAYAGDYVSWCPLGWNNRPVVQIVNVYAGRPWNPWHAWTVIPRGHFGRGHVYVPHVRAVHVDRRIHDTFVVRDTAPETRYAVSRSGVPIRTAGRFAVPRGGAPTVYSSDAGTARQTPGQAEAAERRFPAAARPPRTPSTLQPTDRTDVGRSAAGRAVSRTAPVEGARPSPGPGAETGTRTSESREYRRAPGAAVSRAQEGNVTPAPSGAVRATPQARERSQAAPIDSGAAYGRTRAREDRAPSAGAPAPQVAPARPSDESRSYRTNPGYRAAPQAAPDDRGRAVPRSEPYAPSYGAAPERRGSAGPPPSQGGAPEPRRGPAAAPPSYSPGPEQRRGPSGPPPGASAPPPGSQSAPAERSRPRGDAAPSGNARSRR